jgi:hypothetical protein
VALKTSRKSAIVLPASNPDIVPRLLNVKQAAHYVGCTVWHVRELYWSKAVLGFIARPSSASRPHIARRMD